MTTTASAAAGTIAASGTASRTARRPIVRVIALQPESGWPVYGTCTAPGARGIAKVLFFVAVAIFLVILVFGVFLGVLVF
jgi:hypothetical protein